jgi:lycopene beta-cyclase
MAMRDSANQDPLIIVGGGLAGSLAALVLSRRQPDRPLLLLEAGSTFGGNHTWSFFDSDIPPGGEEWVRALEPKVWSRHRVAFPAHERQIEQRYNAIASPRLDALVRDSLPRHQWRADCQVVRIEPERVVLASGEAIAACSVIDARGPDGPMPGLELGWQKFVGIEFAGCVPDPDCVTIMDARVPQIDGYRFIYTLPLAADRVLVEDTYYSDKPVLDVEQVSARVRAAALAQGIEGAEIRRETGVLPICIGGDPDVFWPADDPVARLGIKGGFFQATTGYSFALALRNALALAQCDDFAAPALAAWSRQQFVAHWQQSAYYRLLNSMIFHAAAPHERYRIFERFYRLSEPLIARFYSGELTMFDKARILTGKPPVPIGAALRSLRYSATGLR